MASEILQTNRVPSAIQLLDETFVLDETVQTETGITGYMVSKDNATISSTGLLTLTPGFNWDGPTGAVNTVNTFVPSAVHDALCYMIADGLLPDSVRLPADKLYRKLLVQWKVSVFRRMAHWRGVRIGSSKWI